jgi:hypothetical protein
MYNEQSCFPVEANDCQKYPRIYGLAKTFQGIGKKKKREKKKRKRETERKNKEVNYFNSFFFVCLKGLNAIYDLFMGAAIQIQGWDETKAGNVTLTTPAVQITNSAMIYDMRGGCFIHLFIFSCI